MSFIRRIFRKQYWGFLRYSSELASEGVAFSKETPSHDFVMYQFPQLLSMLSKTSPLRSLKKEMGKKIGSKMHSSSRKIISKDLPFLKDIFSKKENAIALSAAFELNEKELALILNTKPETKKVKTIIEAAANIIEEKAKPKRIFGETIEEEIQIERPEEPDEPEQPEPPEDDSVVKQTKLF